MDGAIMAKKTPPRSKKETLKLDLALQGGGAHGAFTWGVLDRLLEEEDIEIQGISGTSAGAMNAAVLVDGYHEGGRDKAKKQLHDFWYEISVVASSIAPFGQQAPNRDELNHVPGLDWLAALNPFDMVTRVFSPYEYNPLNFNPLKVVLERVLEKPSLNNGIKLFIAATNVETGEARVFRGDEVTVDVLLASACLPFVYQAVEIDGVPYWDGGYMGNPAIWPLIYGTGCHDVLLVQINPLKRAGTPKSAIDIINRVNEISFNSSLIAEMRAINFVRRLIKQGKLDNTEYADMRIHRVMPPPDLREMNAASKMNASWDFFLLLHSIGRSQMDEWLKQNKKYIGKESSLDIEEHFLSRKAGKSKSKTKDTPC
jgi:NTE family protein